MVSDDTFMNEIINKYKIGFTFRFEEDISDQLYDYYQSLEWTKYKMRCDKFMSEVESDNKEFYRRIKKFDLIGDQNENSSH